MGGTISNADIITILMMMRILIAPIAIAISLISFTSYLKFRNWRLLFLSAAFLLLSIPPTVELILCLSPYLGLSGWTISELFYIEYVFLTASVLPFALLAYVYFNERKTQFIRISRSQWIVGGLLMMAELAIISFTLSINLNSYDFTSELSTLSYLLLINFILGSISYLLIILIIISLFSYYRAKRTRNTKVVMIGFICLLVSQFVQVFSYPPGLDYYLGLGLAAMIALAGYIAFLVALLRLKVLQ